MFLVTPALILIFRANYRRALEQACLITLLTVLFALWIYHKHRLAPVRLPLPA